MNNETCSSKDPLRLLLEPLSQWLKGEVIRAYVDEEQLFVETIGLSLACDLSDGLVTPIGADYCYRLYALSDALRTLRMWYLDYVCPIDESRSPFQGGG